MDLSLFCTFDILIKERQPAHRLNNIRYFAGIDAFMIRLIAFAIFWTAMGMFLMLCFRYRFFGVVFALILLAVSYLILSCDQ